MLLKRELKIFEQIYASFYTFRIEWKQHAIEITFPLINWTSTIDRYFSLILTRKLQIVQIVRCSLLRNVRGKIRILKEAIYFYDCRFHKRSCLAE